MTEPKCVIIAEAGVNHNGRLDLALSLVDEAAKAGADYVKFQTYITENDTIKECEKAEYQKDGVDENQFEMVKRLELGFSDFVAIKERCVQVGIGFLSSPFDLESLRFLDEIDVPFWKVASSEVTNYPLLRDMALTGRPIVMSTGMCDVDDIDAAVALLKRFESGPLTLLHCNTSYPTPISDVNLRAMSYLAKRYSCPVGYSDHTNGIEVPIAAVALGAVVVEKHFTLDRTMEGPDHKASLEPAELSAMVRSIRNVEFALGSDGKEITESERENLVAARKSVVANTHIKAGEVLTEENLAAKRPGGGISPMRWEHLVGLKANRDYQPDDMIDECILGDLL